MLAHSLTTLTAPLSLTAPLPVIPCTALSLIAPLSLIPPSTLTQTLLPLPHQVIALDTGNLNALSQATQIASLTGGSYYPSVSSATIVPTIVNAVVNAPITIKPVVTCSAGSPVVVSVSGVLEWGEWGA